MAQVIIKPSKSLVILALIVALWGVHLASAQSAQGDLEDIQFEISNVTTGEPGTIDRLEIHYSTHVLNPVLDIQPEGSSFTVPAVPIKDIGHYVITAWHEGVPYFWSIRGRTILDGPVTLHVFDTVSDMSAVKVTGLNLLFRKGESVVDLEYMIKVDNPLRPQATITGDPTLVLRVPPEAGNFEVQYTRGPKPIEVPIQSMGSGMVGLQVPLTTGQNQIRLSCTIAWQEGMEIPVGANVPVEAWSLLATPENLDIESFQLEPDNSQDLPGYLRFIGPVLEADQRFSFRVKKSIAAGEAEEVFEAEAPGTGDADPEDLDKENGGRNFPLLIGSPIIVVLIVLIARRRRG